MIRKLMQEREEGFTLIELLVVVIIIGILAAIAIPAFLNQREGAYRASLESDLRNVAIEMESYFAANRQYPAVATDAPGGTATLSATGLPTETFGLSDGVSITFAPGTTPAAAGTFCLQGTHANMTAGGIYDSDGGGLDMSTGTCS